MFLIFTPVVFSSIISILLLSLQAVLCDTRLLRASPRHYFNIPKIWGVRHTRQFLWHSSSSPILKWIHFIYLFIYLSIYSFIHSFIHSFIWQSLPTADFKSHAARLWLQQVRSKQQGCIWLLTCRLIGALENQPQATALTCSHGVLIHPPVNLASILSHVWPQYWTASFLPFKATVLKQKFSHHAAGHPKYYLTPTSCRCSLIAYVLDVFEQCRLFKAQLT